MKRRSAKGEYIDFDLIRAKQQMGAQPTPTDVRNRQSTIVKRLRKKVDVPPTEIIQEQPQPEPEKVADNVADNDTTEPTVENAVEPELSVNESEDIPQRKTRRTKQKAKQPTGNDNDEITTQAD